MSSIPNQAENYTTARPRPRDTKPLPAAPVIDVPIPECDPAEAAYIGVIALDPSAITLGVTDEMLISRPDKLLLREVAAFYQTGNSIGDNGAIDAVKFTDWMKARGISKADRDHFFQCVRDVPTAENAADYAGIIKYKYACRKLIRIAQEMANGAAGDAILETIIATAQTQLAALQQIGQAGGLGAVMQCVSDIEPREITWLWPGRIPLGRISMIVGRPGEGKSFLTAFAAARISVGGYWPDGTHCPQGYAILVSGEDDPADTIRPRLDAHGADCSKIFVLKTVAYRDSTGQKKERGFTLTDIPQLEQALIDHPGVKLIVIDPIGSFLGGKVDGHRDNEIRAVLAPLAALAEKYGCAILIVAHRRKSAAASADDMALGSIGFVGLSRAVWHLSRDENNPERRLLLPGKMNLCRQPDGLAFSIAGEPAAIQWESEPVQMSADDHNSAVNGVAIRGPKPEARNTAEEWLSRYLSGGSKRVSEIRGESTAAGLSWRTVQRAADAIRVVRESDFSTKEYRWSLRPDSSVPSSFSNLAHTNNMASCHPTENKGENTPKVVACQVPYVSGVSIEPPPTVPPVTPPAGNLFPPPAKAPEAAITSPVNLPDSEEII
ncbi:MAG: AAA family ATPase [Phycisphaerae bacterium]